jgi:ABC-type nickel/cobalt efflux system permease component RcnA
VFFITALGVGFLHTLIGPDHYVPFIVIARARRWALGRTMLLTFLCGLGHVLSSVLLGLVGVAAGVALSRVQGWEATRGAWAGWALFLLGIGYTAWGIWRTLRGRHHRHVHLHGDGVLHRHGHDHAWSHPSVHEHSHGGEVGKQREGEVHELVGGETHGHDGGWLHAHGSGELQQHFPGHLHQRGRGEQPVPWKSLTPWILFIVFVLGPCEPLIPLFFASALGGKWDEVLLVVVGYGGATILTMHLLVGLCWFGLGRVDLGSLERWAHALAGAVILLAGGAMVFLGL